MVTAKRTLGTDFPHKMAAGLVKASPGLIYLPRNQY